jgi:hypothetical protein
MKTLSLKDFFMEYKNWVRARYRYDPDVSNGLLVATNMFLLRNYQQGVCIKPFPSWYNWKVLSQDYEYKQNSH